MGTGPRLRSSSVSRVCFIRCKKFKGNFTMALCSFGGVSDQCGATACAPPEQEWFLYYPARMISLNG